MPTILKITLDAKDFEKKRKKVIDSAKEMQKAVSGAGKISITVPPSDKSDLSDLSENMKKIPAAAKESKNGISGLWQEITKTDGACGKLAKSILAGGGAIGVVSAGIRSLLNLASGYLQRIKQDWLDMIDGMKTGASSLEQTAARNIRRFDSEKEAMKTLQSMNSAEKLSAMQKLEIAQAVKLLRGNYRDLNFEIDAGTGKVKDLDKAMLAIGKRQLSVQIGDTERQIKSHEELLSAARGSVSKQEAGAEYWQKVKQQYGFGSAVEAQTVIDSSSNKLQELQFQKAALQNRLKTLDQDFSDRANAGAVDRRRELMDRSDLEAGYKAFLQKQQDDAYNDMDAEEKFSFARESLAAARSEMNRLAAAYNRLAKNEGVADQDQRFRDLKKLGADILVQKEKIYDWERKIATLDKEQVDRQKQLAGEEIRKTLEETQKKHDELERQKQSLQDYVSGFAESFDEQGYVEQALAGAKKAKGGDLSTEESDAVRRIAELTLAMKNRREISTGNLAIRTNDLTARGGFQGGAVAPDSKVYNRMAAESAKNAAEQVAQLRTELSRISKLLQD